MARVIEKPGGEKIAEEELWTFTANPAVRALLDHIAEQLAAEFVGLMKASVSVESDTRPKEEER